MAKRGRPSLGSDARVPLSLRTSPALRALIEEGARLHGRRLSEEAERTLEAAYLASEVTAPRLFADTLGAVLERVEARAGAWNSEPGAWELAWRVAELTFRANMPPAVARAHGVDVTATARELSAMLRDLLGEQHG